MVGARRATGADINDLHERRASRNDRRSNLMTPRSYATATHDCANLGRIFIPTTDIANANRSLLQSQANWCESMAIQTLAGAQPLSHHSSWPSIHNFWRVGMAIKLEFSKTAAFQTDPLPLRPLVAEKTALSTGYWTNSLVFLRV